MNRQVSFKEDDGLNIYWIDKQNNMSVTTHSIDTSVISIIRDKNARIIQRFWKKIKACRYDIRSLNKSKHLKHQWFQRYYPEFFNLLLFSKK